MDEFEGYFRLVAGIIQRSYWDSRGKSVSGRVPTQEERADGFVFFYDGRFAAWVSALGIEPRMMLDEIERAGGGRVGQDV